MKKEKFPNKYCLLSSLSYQVNFNSISSKKKKNLGMHLKTKFILVLKKMCISSFYNRCLILRSKFHILSVISCKKKKKNQVFVLV